MQSRITADPRLVRQSFLVEAEVRALLKRRGWTVALLAQHWSLNKQYIYRLIENEQRPPHWDAAFRGLGRCPVKARRPGRPRQQRAAGQPDAAPGAPEWKAPRRVVGARSAEAPETQEQMRRRLQRESMTDIERTLARLGRMPPELLGEPALSTRGVLRRGQLLVLLDDFQDSAANARAVVIEVVVATGGAERYRIALEDGSVALLLPHQALMLLADTGEVRDLKGLDLSTAALVRSAIADGQLRF